MPEPVHTQPSDPATLRAMEKLKDQFAKQDQAIEKEGGLTKALERRTELVAKVIQRHGEAPQERVTGRKVAQESPAIQAEAAKVASMIKPAG